MMTSFRSFRAGLALVALTAIIGCNQATGDIDANAEQAPAQASNNNDTAQIDRIKQTVRESLGIQQIFKVYQSELPGFYEVLAPNQVIYVSDDAQYFFPGPLISLKEGKLVNLTQASVNLLNMEQAPFRAQKIESIDESNMVVFKAKQEKYVVSVFTDVDCPYCRRLHQNMAEYNASGITIRYLAFPRAGVGSGAYNKLVSIWCADDKQAAMDNAKLNNQFDPKQCDNPIADQFAMTQELGINGTPALILENGQLISGFVKPEELLKQLQSING